MDAKPIPKARVRLIPPTRRGDCYLWEVIACPYCGQKHWHGAGDDPKRVNQFLSHRVEHCIDDNACAAGYDLVREDSD